MTKSHIVLGALGAFVAYKLLSGTSAAAQRTVARRATPLAPNAGMQGGDDVVGALIAGACGVGCACDGMGALADADDGLGRFSFKKLISKPAQILKHDLTAAVKPLKIVAKQVRKDVKRVVAPVIKQVKKDVKIAKNIATFKPARDHSPLLQLLKGRKGGGGGGDASESAPGTDTAAAIEPEYYDADGNRITADQYNALMAQGAAVDASDVQPFADPNAAEDVTGDDLQPFSDDAADAAAAAGGDAAEDALYAFSAPDGETSPYDNADDDGLPVLSPEGSQTGAENATDNGGDAGDAGSSDTSPLYYDRGVPDNDPANAATDEDLIMGDADEPQPASADEAGQFVAEEYEDPNEAAYRAPLAAGDLQAHIRGNTIEYFDGESRMDGLADLVRIDRGRPLVIAQHDRRSGKVGVARILADRSGNLFAWEGARLHGLGHVDDLAGADGLGLRLFGRSWGSIAKKVVKTEKNIHSAVDPVGASYKWLTTHPKYYAKYRRTEKTVVPYVAIAGAAVATIYSGGAAAPTLVAAVADLGAQGYKDYRQNVARREEGRAEEQAMQDATDGFDAPVTRGSLTPASGPAPGELPGGDTAREYGGDGVDADFLNLDSLFAS